MKQRTKPSQANPRHLGLSISVTDSSHSLRPSVASVASVASPAKTVNDDDCCGRVVGGLCGGGGAEMAAPETTTISNVENRRPSLPIQELAATAASSLQQQQQQQHLLTRHGSAKASIGERPRQHHQQQHQHQQPHHQHTSHSRQLSATAAAATRGYHSLTVGGQPRGPRPLAHSAMIAAAAAAHAAAVNSAAASGGVGLGQAASSSSTSCGATGGVGAAAACSRQQMLPSTVQQHGNAGGHSNRHFSVKRVDEDLPFAGISAESAPTASAEETFNSKSELLETRRQQQRQHLRSSNAVPTLNEEELPPSALGSDAASGCCEDEGIGGFNDSLYCDDLCPLCDTCVKNSRGRTTGLQLDDNPGVIRWQKLPCACPDRYLHHSCLETSFYDDAVYKGGRRRLIIACQVCKSQLLIRRHRGRRTCDHTACLSFTRHLLSVLLIAGFLIAFGLWSLFHPIDGRPTVLNVGLISMGGLALLLFAVYEFWLLHGRFDFVISRLNGRGTQHHHHTTTATNSSSIAKASAANNNNKTSNNNNNNNNTQDLI